MFYCSGYILARETGRSLPTHPVILVTLKLKKDREEKRNESNF
jgi:hypothetical protein